MRIWKIFKAGLLWSGVIVVIVSLAGWVLSLLSNFVIVFSDNKLLNLGVNVLIYTVVIWLVGWLIGRHKLRQFFLKIFSKIPIVSMVTDFLLNNDYIDKVTGGEVPEVFFQYAGEWTFGVVVNRFKFPAYMTYGDIEPWVMVIVPTLPVAVTGPAIFKREREVIYTGRAVKDTVIAGASFGLNFPQPDVSKFRKGSPLN